jgi:hypothetical protein
MTKHLATIPARTHSSKHLLAISATTYLALAIALGVHAAFYLVVLAAVIALWVVAARRFPVVGWLTYVFFDGFLGGFISGLFGYRGGYGYYGRRTRRW